MCFENCRPLGFLIGLPFMLVAFLLSAIGVVLWIITWHSFMIGVLCALVGCGLGTFILIGWTLVVPLAFCCPCLVCCTCLAEFALSLIKAPFRVITWFTEQIPC